MRLQEWFFDHGVMPLYTPVGGSWLNMAESVQHILVPRALAGQYPKTPQEIIDWLEQTVDGWNENPTPQCPGTANGDSGAPGHACAASALSGAVPVSGYTIAATPLPVEEPEVGDSGQMKKGAVNGQASKTALASAEQKGKSRNYNA
jgi:hypothetical protein